MRQTKFHADHLQLLSGPGWSLCEGLIKAFEEAWRRGAAPSIADYLCVEGPERAALLLELVHVDLEFRLKAGESARVESYWRAFPELAKDHGEALELIAAEYDLRRRHHGDADLDEYRRRFPQFRNDLLDRLPTLMGDTPDPAGQAGETLREWPAVPGYDVIERIGRGGMGIVFKARERSLGRHVALKFLPVEYAGDAERLERFLREAQTASALNHPYICTVHALGENEGHPFLVMELIEGATLQTMIEDRPGLETALSLIHQAAQALAAAHAAGVVHRDIKPENIMVRPDGYVKVVDFGLARRLPTLVQAEQETKPNTDPGAIMGTVGYMSPEQSRGDPAVSASDVFALGIVLYQLVTGQHPFQAESPLGTLYAIASRPVVSPSRLNAEIPVALDGLIEAMLHKDARLRPTAAEVQAGLEAVASAAAALEPVAPRPIVHREPELAALRAALADAEAGRGRLVCVAGEPGIGKTTLVEDFLEELTPSGCRVARGPCFERLADAEAYLPVMQALESLMRVGAGGSVARLLKVVAPTWHAQVVPTAADGAAQPQAHRASTQQAMLREFLNWLREVSRLETLVLFFDDVHWADLSTVDLLAYLGRNCSDLRVLTIVTYRPTEMLLGPHPFLRVKLELQGKGVCSELALGFLGREQVDRYLELAFPGHAFPADFADLIHAQTEGNPLFMADLLRYLRERGTIAETAEKGQAAGPTEARWVLARDMPDVRLDLPASVRGMIERELERLEADDRRLLGAAAVQGHEFDSAVAAGALNLDPADVEERLQALDRLHGLVRLVRDYEFPDRTLTRRYAFVHVLYQQALYNDLQPTRRAALARSLARVLEKHYGEGSPAVAASLACLHEVGRDFAEAAKQFYLAAQNAARVFAHQDAVELARRALRLLEALPEGPERTKLELPLQTTLGLQLQVTQGYAAPAAREAYDRARALCQRFPGTAPLFPVLWGLWLFHKVRSELVVAQERADELLALARQGNDAALALQAHQALGITALCRGRPEVALDHAEQAAACYDPDRHRTHSNLFGQDPGLICKAYGAVALWLLGFPDSAAAQSDAAMQMSRELSPTNQALALHFAAMVHQLRRDAVRTRLCAEASVRIAAEHGFSFWLAGGMVLCGWAAAAEGSRDEGVRVLWRGIRDWDATGSVTYKTYYLGLLAETLGWQGNADAARRVLDEALALACETKEGLCKAELYRLKGETLLGSAPETAALDAAETLIRQALELAQRQRARSLELRAVTSLARLHTRFNRATGGLDLLSHVVGGFHEGHDTTDLREARRLLAASS